MNEMILESCLRRKGAPDFDQALFQEIESHASQLPLQGFCTSGGSPAADNPPALHDFHITSRSPSTVRGSFTVDFTESFQAGIRDLEWAEGHVSEIRFALDLKTGRMGLEGEYAHRECEPEEF